MNAVSVITEAFQEWPEEVSLLIGFGQCNFRCFFCHMKNVIYNPSEWIGDAMELYHKHKHPFHTALIVSGGEPTLWKVPLKELLRQAKKDGLKTKVFSNASIPSVISSLLQEGLVDAFSFDFKGTENLQKILQIYAKDSLYLNRFKESIALCKEYKIPVEIRVTKHNLLKVKNADVFLKKECPGIPVIWQECVAYED